MLKKVERGIILLENGLTVILVFGIVLAVFLQVLSRYILHAPLSWTEELSRALLIWLTFVGGALALRSNSHFVLEILVGKLPAKVRTFFELFLIGLMAAFVLILFDKGIAMLPVVHLQTSASLRIPMSYIYLAIPVGAALMLIHILQITLRTFVRLKNPCITVFLCFLGIPPWFVLVLL